MEDQIAQNKQLLKRMRKNIRISLTKKITKFEKHMANEASEEKVKTTISELQDVYTEAQSLHEEFQNIELNVEDDPGWLKNIDDIIKDTNERATQYLAELNEAEHEKIENRETKVMNSVPVVESHESNHGKTTSKGAYEEMIDERILFINDQIKQHASSIKLTCLHDDLKEQLRQITELDPYDSSWLRKLAHQVTKCSSDVLEYIEKYKNAHADNHNTASSSQPIEDQLERIKLPKFEGKKELYFNWKAAFSACVDNTSTSSEIKLLHLKQCLQGDALQSIAGLGHTKAAYVKSLEILERKYGGERRKTAMYIEQVDQFIPLKNNNFTELERLSELLERLIVRFQDTGRTEDLGSGILFVNIQKKLTNSLLTQYHRWCHEKSKDKTVVTLSEFISLESEFQSEASETINGISNNKTRINQIRLKCVVCTHAHNIDQCETFNNLQSQKRWDLARKHMLCYKCLKKGHTIKACRSNDTCCFDSCNKKHHTKLHINSLENTRSYSKNKNETNLKKEGMISLRTVPVIIHYKGKKIHVNALLDDGSEQTFINEDIARGLDMDEQNGRDITIDVFNGNDISVYTSEVEFEISNCLDEKRYKISSMTSKKVVGDLKAVNWKEHGKSHPDLSNIPFGEPSKQGNIGILIGIDHPHLHASIQESKGVEEGGLRARLTPLGWTCVGKMNTEYKYRIRSTYISKVSMFAHNQQDLSEINTTLNKFWEIESVETQDADNFSSNDKLILEKTKSTLRRSSDNERYQVSIPWKHNKTKLAGNFGQAIQRLRNTESQLKKKPLVKQLYKENLSGYMKKGYIKAVTKQEIHETKWYLPHFPVVKMQKETSKVRIVFDASAKKEGLSLNDTIHQGPNLQQDLFKVLLRFRKNKIALVCDISEMYMQVELAPEDRKYFRFLWRDDTHQYPSVYEFQRVIFGGNASPFLAQLVSRENALEFVDSLPRAVETILESTYMDDSLDSVETSNDAIKLYKDLTSIWKNAGMSAKKWLSNDSETLKFIPTKDRAGEIDLAKVNGLPTTKTLGIVWDAEDDVFKFCVAQIENQTFSKREFLKLISSIFDPLGFLAAFIIRAKIIMQTLWIQKLDWDETISNETSDAIMDWVSELEMLVQVKVPRCLSTITGIYHSELHVFVDASENAMAAVTYVCRHNVEDIVTQFVCAKTKVAPLEAMSTPRLELLAAELGINMSEKTADVLSFNKKDIYYWTDSQDVLGWIQNRSRIFKPFVSHRIGKIQQSSSVERWMYVPSKLNPADLASRGIKALELVEREEWYKGPKFLRENRNWPIQPNLRGSKLKEMKGHVTMNLLATRKTDWRLNPERFSSWKRLYRVTAWTLRFIANCGQDDRITGPLTQEEIEESKMIHFKIAQLDGFEEEVIQLSKGKECSERSKISVLCPRIDDNGILRANTRMESAEFLNFNTKFPIILPRGHKITQLIVKDFHEAGNHVRGTNGTLSDISTQFWIVSGREEIREWEAKCSKCKTRRAKMAKQIMAPLPVSRLGISMKAFDKSAVDYAGPFSTKAGRGKTRFKRYLCLFSCMATRAVHLEMAYALDTGSFMNAFWRFTHRRGVPSEMTSDNGSNFVAGEKELRELVTNLDQESLIDHTSIVWKFNPPYSPHHGGVFETMIKAAKRAMYSQLKDADFTDEELLTAITGAEAMLNSRPITYRSASPDDINPLTPNHFLHGQLGGKFSPEMEVEKTTINRRWKYVQKILGQFWRRWIKEWIPSIGKRNKWTNLEQNLKEGDIVVVMMPDVARMKWPLGRIVEAIKGKDGNVRKVKVLVKEKILLRGLNTIYPLKLDDTDTHTPTTHTQQ